MLDSRRIVRNVDRFASEAWYQTLPRYEVPSLVHEALRQHLLIAARVDAYTGDFMVAEQKDEACLRKEINFQYGDHLRFEQSLNSIWAVLSSLYEMDLTVGSYLLRHSEKDGVSVEVLCATDEERASFDLHDTFTSINTEETVVKDPNEQWRPLDPFMVLPVHRALERPPVTFEPSGGKYLDVREETYSLT